MGRNVLLLMMGGSGTRFGADVPKQFIKVNNKPIFSYVVGKYDSTNILDEMVIVCHETWIDYTREFVESMNISVPFSVVVGGSSRSESVKNGLIKLSENASADDVVLIHDATHPYLDDDILSEIIIATREYGGATAGAPQYDTVYQIDPETRMLTKVVPRETVMSGASPEAFLFGKIFEIYSTATAEELEKRTSAGALALHYGISMKVVNTSLVNLKITYKHDLEVFKKLFYNYYF